MKLLSIKKFLLPFVAVFGVITVFNLIFHEFLMSKLYFDNSELFRSQDEIQKGQTLMHIANLIYSFTFCYIYSKGYESGQSLAQGIRYGIWISLLIWLPQLIVDYVVFPYPTVLQISWFIGYTVQTLLAGVTLATTYKE